MENSHPVFLAGEYVQIAPLATLQEIDQQYAGEKGWMLNPYSLFPSNMVGYADQQL